MRYSPQTFFLAETPAPIHQEVKYWWVKPYGTEEIVPLECNKRYVRTPVGMIPTSNCTFFGPVPEVREASKCLDPLPTYSEERSMLEEDYRHAGETFHV